MKKILLSLLFISFGVHVFAQKSPCALWPVLVASRSLVCNSAPDSVIMWVNQTSISCVTCKYAWTSSNPSETVYLNAQKADTLAVIPGITTTYSVHVSDSLNNCQSSSEDFTVTVSAPFADLVSNQSACQGSTTSPFYFKGNNGPYSWKIADPSIGLNLLPRDTGSFLPSFIANNPVTTDIEVTPLIINGDTCVGKPVTFKYTVNPFPAPAILTNTAASICKNTSNQNFSTDKINVDYSWSVTNAQISAGKWQKDCKINFPYGGSSVVMLDIYTSEGCHNFSSYSVNVDSVNNSSSPELIYQKPVFICIQDDASSYQWGYDDQTLAEHIATGETGQQYAVPDPDPLRYYWVETSSGGGCNQKVYYNAPPQGIKDPQPATSGIIIFPNPSSTILNIEINNFQNEFHSVRISDVLGRIVYETGFASQKMRMNISDLPKGIYEISAIGVSGKMINTKFVKN